MAERIALVGMMGAGKTTVGRLLAEHLSCEHLDSDAQVEAATGRTVPEILRTDGEAAFRVAEARALEAALDQPPPVVVSVAGGAVLDPTSRALLAERARVVWLRAAVGTLAVRVGGGEGRPLLGDDPAANLARLYEAREPLYAELAEVVIDVDDREPDDVVAAIVAAVL